MRLLCGLAAALALAACGPSETGQAPGTAMERAAARAAARVPPPANHPDVMYVPTRQAVVDEMLTLGEVGAGDVLYDLGSGDGRIPITAARRFGVRAVGIEIDDALVAASRANARAAGVEHLVSFRSEDLFEADFSEASVVTLYLLDSLNEKLRPRLLAELRPGARIVSHDFGMGDWEPEKAVQVGRSRLYLWRVPERGGGAGVRGGGAGWSPLRLGAARRSHDRLFADQTPWGEEKAIRPASALFHLGPGMRRGERVKKGGRCELAAVERARRRVARPLSLPDFVRAPPSPAGGEG